MLAASMMRKIVVIKGWVTLGAVFGTRETIEEEIRTSTSLGKFLTVFVARIYRNSSTQLAKSELVQNGYQFYLLVSISDTDSNNNVRIF